MMSFTHPRLKCTKPVRLIRLKPCSYPELFGIDCSIEVVSLVDKPEYAALSYTWQPMSPEHQIHIDQKTFTIGHSLWQFLAVAAKDPRLLALPLWIDQISINQKDVVERNQQVSLMREIYALSTRTLVWLGPAADGSDAAIEGIKRHLVNTNTYLLALAKGFQSQAMPETEANMWDAVTQLFERPYWDRLWIVQEFWLSKNTTLICGSSTFGLDHRLEKRLVTMIQNRHTNREFRRFRRAPSFRRLVDARQGENIRQGVKIRSLIEFMRQQCTDPRDRVFGLMGLLDEERRVPINYTLSLEQVLVKLYRVLLNPEKHGVERLQLSDHETVQVAHLALAHLIVKRGEGVLMLFPTENGWLLALIGLGYVPASTLQYVQANRQWIQAGVIDEYTRIEESTKYVHGVSPLDVKPTFSESDTELPLQSPPALHQWRLWQTRRGVVAIWRLSGYLTSEQRFREVYQPWEEEPRRKRSLMRQWNLRDEMADHVLDARKWMTGG